MNACILQDPVMLSPKPSIKRSFEGKVLVSGAWLLYKGFDERIEVCPVRLNQDMALRLEEVV